MTVHDDLALWQRGLAPRPGVKIVRFPHADHLFFNGNGPSTPLEYIHPAHVDPRVATTIDTWIHTSL